MVVRECLLALYPNWQRSYAQNIVVVGSSPTGATFPKLHKGFGEMDDENGLLRPVMGNHTTRICVL